MTHLLRSLIRETLLLEEVYGAQAVVYHGTRADPQELISALLNDEFVPGKGSGSMYGKGLYTVYNFKGTKTEKGEYGDHVIKLKVNLYGYIIFDPDIALKVYKKPLTPAQQAEEVGYSETVIKALGGVKLPRDGVFTSDSALNVYKSLQYEVKGLVFTGNNDGHVAVVYDPTTAVPMAWKKVLTTAADGRKKMVNEPWTPVDRAALLEPRERPDVSAREGRPVQQSALRRSAIGDFEVGKWDPLARLNRLPEDKRVVKGDLNLNHASITSLPSGLQVDGDLDLQGTLITSLPPGLRVGGSIDLRNTPVTSLSANLQVGRDLNLRNTPITSLPADLDVRGSLYLSGTPITELPAGLKVGGGSLYLTDTPITSLPKDFEVGGTLYLIRTSVTSLPAGLKVGRDLDLIGTPITALPADLKVGGYIYGFAGDKSNVPKHLKGKLL